jgi:hypothetical protein
MTEEQWRACDDPRRMLDFLRGKATERKVRLFAAASVRRVWTLLTDERSRGALEVAERFADRLANEEELAEAEWAAAEAVVATRGEEAGLNPVCFAALAAHVSARNDLSGPGSLTFQDGVSNGTGVAALAVRPADAEERRSQAGLLRCIIGNPFRPASLDPAWLTPTVTSLATVVYEERALPSGELDTARLAVLADALEEAGCDNADVLGHLRGPGPHVRGCWAVDLLTGRS